MMEAHAGGPSDNESPESNPVVAIDGPAASGKSSVAREVAKALGFVFVSSGAMYRAFTWEVLRRGANSGDRDAVLSVLGETGFQCATSDGAATILVNGADPGEAAHTGEVNANVSTVAAYPEVRKALLVEQRGFAHVGTGVVMEGRDIGTVVFPDTPYKFYVDASPEVRQARRRAQGIEDSVLERDKQDSSRETAPLRQAEDAAVIDSSDLTLGEVVGKVLRLLKEKGLAAASGA